MKELQKPSIYSMIQWALGSVPCRNGNGRYWFDFRTKILKKIFWLDHKEGDTENVMRADNMDIKSET